MRETGEGGKIGERGKKENKVMTGRRKGTGGKDGGKDCEGRGKGKEGKRCGMGDCFGN